MEFKQDDSCSVQKSSCFLEIPFFKLSLTKGTLYYFETVPFTYTLIVSAFSFKEILDTKIHTIKQHIPLNINGNLFPISNINPEANDPTIIPIAL